MKKRILFFIGTVMLYSLAFCFESNYIQKEDGSRLLNLDSPFFTFQIQPEGGLIKSLIYKTENMQLVDPDSVGSGTENVWNIGQSRFFLQKKTFTLSSRSEGDTWVVSAEANHGGGGINFLNVEKNFRFFQDSALVQLDYKLANLPAAMSALDYAFWFHNAIGVYGELMTTYFPSTDGIVTVSPEKYPTDIWIHQPARPWIANVGQGKGVVMTMSFPELKHFYSWYSGMKIPSIEWRTVPISIEAGKSFDTRVEIIPFVGLDKVSGAGNGLVGEIAGGEKLLKLGENAELECKIYNARKGKIYAELFTRKAGEIEWKSFLKKELNFQTPGSLQSFSCSLNSAEKQFMELEVILSNEEKELARLNSYLNFADFDSKWKIDLLEQRLTGGSATIDLLRYNKTHSTGHIAWCKPYSVGKLRTLILTQNTNISEATQFAQRLDMDLTVPFLLLPGRHAGVSPIYKLGDDAYGATSLRDIDDNLEKALSQEYDLIINALPWSYFKEDFQKKIQEKVNKGTGLVYIGANENIDFLPLKGTYQGTVMAAPKVVKKHFLTEGIPFEIFANEEINKFDRDAEALVSAAGFPYLSTGKYGQGTVIALNYRAIFGRFDSAAGLTPNLPDRYENKGVPYEFYFSLLAKCALQAANKLPQLSFNNVDLQTSDSLVTLKIDYTSDVQEESMWSFSVYNRYMDYLAEKKERIFLQKGTQENTFSISLKDFTGPRTISLHITNKSGQVLNWGTWLIPEKNLAEVVSIKIDKENYQDNETVNFSAKFKADNPEDLTVIAELEDSYKRIIAQEKSAFSENISGKLLINNELPARFYRLKISIYKQNQEIDRLYKDFVVRPEKSKLKWDDYEVGTWMTEDGSRFYLWKHQADILHKLKIKTLISNWRPLDHNFPLQYNFHPTMLYHAGLGRCAEPPEYAETGDKMKLVRKPCLSDKEFQEKMVDSFQNLGKEQQKYALRFIWLGDEQSITGYGGTPTDFCFSEFCLHEFRNFLEKKYANLQTLNKEWNCNFSSWEQVLPFTKDEIWNNQEKNVAGWADHLEFMDGRLENMVSICTQAGKVADSDARFSISGTQAPTAYGGMDWWRQMKVFDGLMNYYVGGQHELQRSFRPDGEYMPWEFGYSSKGGVLGYKIWKTLFLGYRGIMGFHYPSLVNPDWSLSKNMSDALPYLQVLSDGMGKHYLNNLQAKSNIAILYSQASIRAAFIEKRRDEHRLLREKLIAIMRHIGANFDFISYEQLAEGILIDRAYETLILPDSSALSDNEIQEVISFANSGNKIIAIGIPGRRKQNCAIREKNDLHALFKNSNNVLIDNINVDYMEALAYPEKKENYDLLLQEQMEWKKLLGKKAFAGFLEKVETESGIVADIEYYNRFDRNGNPYFGLITNNSQQRYLTVNFPREGYVYNLANGANFGRTKEIEFPFNNALPALLAVFPTEAGFQSIETKAGGKIKVQLKQNYPSAIRIQVYSPDGGHVQAYAKNILIENRELEFSIPFAISDPKGKWTIILKEMISGEIKEINIQNNFTADN